jgi:hypothetical protein
MLLPTMQFHIPSTFTVTEIKQWRDNKNNTNDGSDMHKYNHDDSSMTNSNDNATQQLRDGIVGSSFVESCITYFDDEEINPFELVPGWEYYRLGDCIKLCQGCDNGSKIKKIKKGTFAADYFQHHCPGDRSNLTAIEEVLQRRIASLQQQQQQSLIVSPYDISTVPDPDVLVIHLRPGDAIEKYAEPSNKCSCRNSILKTQHSNSNDLLLTALTNSRVQHSPNFAEP